MKTKIKYNRLSFDEFCETVKRVALVKAALYAESLNLNNLKTQARFGRIYTEIDALCEKRNTLNWPSLMDYLSDPEVLFDMFEKLGYLDNPKEMEKLQQAFILYEENNQLQWLLAETIYKEQYENYQARKLALRSKNDKSGKKEDLKNKITVQKQDVHPKEFYPSSYIKSQKRIYQIRKNLYSFGYRMPEGFLYSYVLEMNIQFNFLSPLTSIEQFIEIITSKDWTKLKGKVYLGCQTNEFKYVIHHLQKYFTSLSWARIGRSGFFVSNQGTVIKAPCLRSSSYNKILKKEVIDKIYM